MAVTQWTILTKDPQLIAKFRLRIADRLESLPGHRRLPGLTVLRVWCRGIVPIGSGAAYFVAAAANPRAVA